jgi:putative redox protein
VIGLVEEAGMARVREAEEYIVTNRAEAEMIDRTACAVHVRGFPPLVSDEPPSRGGQDRGQSPLELLLASLCACTNVTTGRMADKLRFEYSGLEMHDTRGRRGLADVPVHYRAVRLHVAITTDEPDKRVERLAGLVARYCPVDTLMRPVVPDFEVTWERRSD